MACGPPQTAGGSFLQSPNPFRKEPGTRGGKDGGREERQAWLGLAPGSLSGVKVGALQEAGGRRPPWKCLRPRGEGQAPRGWSS